MQLFLLDHFPPTTITSNANERGYSSQCDAHRNNFYKPLILLSTYYMPDIVLDIRDTSVTERDVSLPVRK